MRAPASEQGQVLPLLTLVIVLAGLACLLAGKLGGAAVARAQASTAADAAALAGVAAGAEAAERAAAANGGRVTAYATFGTDARVDVELGGAHASARARRSGGGRPGPDGALAPAMRAALARAGQLIGRPVPVLPPPTTGELGDAHARHAQGLAIDVPAGFVPTLLAVASGAGLCQPYPAVHPHHFQLCAVRLP